jgi:hypothetical protein
MGDTAKASFISGEPVVGLEPTTRALRMRCSTTELYRRGAANYHSAFVSQQKLTGASSCCVGFYSTLDN